MKFAVGDKVEFKTKEGGLEQGIVLRNYEGGFVRIECEYLDYTFHEDRCKKIEVKAVKNALYKIDDIKIYKYEINDVEKIEKFFSVYKYEADIGCYVSIGRRAAPVETRYEDLFKYIEVEPEAV